MSASQAIQDNVNTLESRLQTGAHDDGTLASEQQMSIWRNDLASKQEELAKALEEEAQQQERFEAEEAEIESIELPYDFEELFGEEGRPVVNLNKMIIEVVKDTKRQANIEKNQVLVEQKHEYEFKLEALKSDYNEVESQKNILLSQNRIMEEREHQAVLERDDAFSKRDAAFRQLQEARDEIEALKTKLENVPSVKQSFDVSPSDKLAIMVKESLEAKVNRGLARWADIIPVQVPEVESLKDVSEEEAPAEENSFPEDKMDATHYPRLQDNQGDQSLEQVVPEKSEVRKFASGEETEARFKRIEEHLGLKIWNAEVYIDRDEQEVA